MANNFDDWLNGNCQDLYAMIFDAPIQNKKALISSLEDWGCEKIRQGPTEHSIEFYLNIYDWPKNRWQNWNILMAAIHKGYDFNRERSCLPTN